MHALRSRDCYERFLEIWKNFIETYVAGRNDEISFFNRYN